MYILIFTYFISIIIKNYTRDQLLALRSYGSNTICLAMRPRSGKYSKEIGYEASYLITVPITPYNETAVQHVIIGLQIVTRSVINLVKYMMLLRIWTLMFMSLQRLG